MIRICYPGGGTGPYTYAWTFGDGETSDEQNPAHTYIAPGTFTVNVTVTDSASHSTMWSTTVTVTGVPPIPELSVTLIVPAAALLFFVLGVRNRRKRS